MDEKNQIEEMTLEITKLFCNPKGCYNCNLCDAYGSLELSCEEYLSYRRMASVLYAAGYRKQSEAKWVSEIVKRCDWKGREQSYYQPNSCSNCHESVTSRTPFCPFCGKKMKGE